MSDEQQRPGDESEAARERPEADAGAPAAEDPEAVIAALRDEVSQYRDAALRARAEAENVRKRAERDVENAHKFALEKFAGQLLPVADSLEKSVQAAEELGSEDSSIQALKEGVELSRRIFLDTLGRVGIEQVDPAGQPFDPNVHEAMSMVESGDVPANTVVHVLQKGFTLNGRLLRAAMVTVAKGAS
ncbi:MAG: nucleotide exchange factor GrpE [Gammaproteobacteria bacterium]|nr:nucleotide exchange factor GrpE [Gammaproteobacteria bacterium]